MNKKLLIVIAATMLCCQMDINAMPSPNESTAPKKEAVEKSSKAARNEAKKLKKEGWVTMPGALPLENQIDKAYQMRMESNDYGQPIYIIGQGVSIGSNYDAAKMQALETAKQQIAGQLQSEISAIIQNSMANMQISQTEAETITKLVMSAKSQISQSIGRTIPIMELHRTNEYGKKEVLVCIAYNSEQGLKAAENAIKRQAGDDANLNEQISQIFGKE